MKFVLEI